MGRLDAREAGPPDASAEVLPPYSEAPPRRLLLAVPYLAVPYLAVPYLAVPYSDAALSSSTKKSSSGSSPPP
ncbi:hypothetical protein GCM10010472_55580 [Pseudonocardia halophobica]|uniref:Uncharacterized protein n=1 Tax=Pseudonocardia halophobica TaxID=29401 RepID=A0A9W6L5W6_9PSEU|nr:hypothetical protein GCM10017577_27750 [Pseudonocardia halophobica]